MVIVFPRCAHWRALCFVKNFGRDVEIELAGRSFKKPQPKQLLENFMTDEYVA